MSSEPISPLARKIILLLAASLTVMSGATIAPSLPAMAEVFRRVEDPEFVSKLLLTIPALFIAVFSPVAGGLIDRFGRRPTLFAGLVLYGVGGASGILFTDPFWILAGRALMGIAVAGVMTTGSALVADYFVGEERQHFVGLQAAFMALGGIVYISLGGVLADIHWRGPFYLYLAAWFLLWPAIRYLTEPDREYRKTKNTSETATGATHTSPDQPGNARTGTLDGQKSPAGKWKLTVGLIYGLSLFHTLIFYMIPTQIPFLIKQLGIDSPSMTGLAISVSTLSAATVSLNYRRLKMYFRFRHIYTLAFLLIGTGYLGIGLTHSYGWLVATLTVAGAGLGFMMPNSQLWLMGLASPHNRGRVMGGVSTFIFIGMFFSPMAVDRVGKIFPQNWDIWRAFQVGGMAALVLSVISFAWGLFPGVPADTRRPII